MILVTTKEIGERMWVHYRAKVLGIKPYKKGIGMSPNFYTIEDAELIKNYQFTQSHSIRCHKVLEYILINRYRKIWEVSEELAITEYKAKILLDEYDKSGCIIVESKLNRNESN